MQYIQRVHSEVEAAEAVRDLRSSGANVLFVIPCEFRFSDRHPATFVFTSYVLIVEAPHITDLKGQQAPTIDREELRSPLDGVERANAPLL